jgi:hypothetical protein
VSIRRRVPAAEGIAAVRAVLGGADDRASLATASRYLLEQLADEAEGHTVEVRVPPFGAVQAVPGPRHTRGTPPNVVEMDAATWIALATGAEGWDAAVAELRVAASGRRATLAEHLPLRWETMEG